MKESATCDPESPITTKIALNLPDGCNKQSYSTDARSSLSLILALALALALLSDRVVISMVQRAAASLQYNLWRNSGDDGDDVGKEQSAVMHMRVEAITADSAVIVSFTRITIPYFSSEFIDNHSTGAR
jgi:hypothetical protein